MKIIIDAMGGDEAPVATLAGAAAAVREYGMGVVAVGRQEDMAKAAKEHGISLDGIETVHAADVLGMDEDATDVVRKRPESSLAVGLRLLKEGEGDALVSAGATGALLVGATMIAGRIKGIKRAAIASIIPGSEKPWLLADCGANVECRAEQLVQFAMMGAAYMEKVMAVARPAVGLASNGSEESKGTPLLLEAHALLKGSGLHFIGNVEARDFPAGVADVIVCDGFTGNIILKMMEGAAKMFAGQMREMFYKNTKSKIAGLLVKDGLVEFKNKFDYKEYGGAPLLGIEKPVIKAHGSSDERAIKNAMRQAKMCVENDVCGTIQAWVRQHK